ncbi:hypothetical protein GCM10007049_31410 [Echinicola pacifica]|uniref:Uncharacterized protein n=1 Tax=Echinicola pacifica TaxID=346377 RepID=A0A918Q8U1_9BACT|nr:hypothetical protein [Echinicola pacifica]GGZ35849.1 hypothetical protein GCM10007049_31410 [Echinicola pacifica]
MMKFLMHLVLKLTFLLSLMPYLVSEKIYDKYQVRIDPQVVDSLYTKGYEKGLVDRKILDEASGLASSKVFDNLIYTHNDSDGAPVVYKIDSLGQSKGAITLSGIYNRDWEDIAVGPNATGDKSIIYVGEIGDNQGRYPSIKLYSFEEPHSEEGDVELIPHVTEMVYPDGPRDAETLMVDPWDGEVYIISKRDSSNVLFRVPTTHNDQEKVTLEKVLTLPVTMSVAGDISPDGTEIILKNYWVVYHWARLPGQSLKEAMSAPPVQLPYLPEPQGEALTFAFDGKSYFSLSEERFRIKPALMRYYRK